MGLERAYTFGRGWTGQAIQWRPGDVTDPTSPAAPDDYLPLRTNTMKAPFDMLDEYVATATKFANRIYERSHIKPEGDVGWFGNPTFGLSYYEGLLGAKTALTPVVPAATPGPIVTGNGLSTIPVPSTTGYVSGAWIDVNTDVAGVAGLSTESVRITEILTGHLVTKALTINAAAVTGIFVGQPAQTKYANSLLSSALSNMLPYMTIERSKGGIYSIQYPTTLAEKLVVSFTKDAIELTQSLFGTARPRYLSATGAEDWAQGVMNAYAPSSSDEELALRPFTSIDAALVASQDPEGTGSLATRAALGITDCKITFDNALDKEITLGSKAYTAWGSDKVSCMVEYTEVDLAHRPAIWIELIEGSKGVPFHAEALKNFGTLAAPAFKGVGYTIPNLRYGMQDDDEKAGQVSRFALKGKAVVVPTLPQDMLQVFVRA